MTISKKQNNIFVLKQKIKEAEGTLTLKFSPVKGAIFSFQPGQFVLASFLDKRAAGKIRAYSISGIPREKFLAITVKKAGVFSSALHKMKIGEKIKISPPQGNFYPTQAMKNLVFLAAGIGIAPFFGIIKDFYQRKAPQKIFLFYSNRTKKESVFLKQLDEIARKWSGFKKVYFLTREKTKIKNINEYQRIDVKTVKKYLKNLAGKNYFICGPNEFVNNLRQGLKKTGVRGKFIKIEVF
jgi:ferredoxin-NADP reductase